MRIVQAVWGVFHHFDLARELEQRGHLKRGLFHVPVGSTETRKSPAFQSPDLPLVSHGAVYGGAMFSQLALGFRQVRLRQYNPLR